jgi:hypothetical protein
VAAGHPAAGIGGRDSAELTALADHHTAHGIALEMLAGPLPGIYGPTGTGDPQFATPRAGDHRVMCSRPPTASACPA